MSETNSSPHSILAILASETLLALRFYSRLPVPSFAFEGDPHRAPDFRTLPRILPFAGAIITVPALFVAWIAALIDLSSFTLALLVVASLVIVTGAMAEDGFADVADGFFGGHTAERRLEIMADSRVGAFGVVALILALGVKASSLATLFDHHGVIALSAAILVSGALSRVAGILPLVFLPPVRPGGRSASVGRPSVVVTTIAIVTVLSLGALILFFGGIPPRGISAGLLLGFASVFPMLVLAQSKIGGQTGDVAGATQQVAEIVFLIALSVA